MTRAPTPAAADQFGVWTRIAASFDATRRRPWPAVAAWLRALRLPPGARVLDLMAGNGRHARAAAQAGLRPTRVDWSRPLLALAARDATDAGDAVVGDAARLPLRDACFDAALCVAGLHGLPDPAARAACLAELRRVLRPGAGVLLTVWDRAAPRFADVPPGVADVQVPWRADGHDETRTYHLYTDQTLRAAAEAAGLRVQRLERVALGSTATAQDNLWLEATAA